MCGKVFQVCLNGQLLRILFVPSRMSLLRRSQGFDLPLLCWRQWWKTTFFRFKRKLITGFLFLCLFGLVFTLSALEKRGLSAKGKDKREALMEDPGRGFTPDWELGGPRRDPLEQMSFVSSWEKQPKVVWVMRKCQSKPLGRPLGSQLRFRVIEKQNITFLFRKTCWSIVFSHTFIKFEHFSPQRDGSYLRSLTCGKTQVFSKKGTSDQISERIP